MPRILCTATSSRLLHLLAARGPLDISCICHALELKPARVRHVLCALRHRGFVIRTDPSPGAGPLPVASSCRYAADLGKVDTGLSKLLLEFGVVPEYYVWPNVLPVKAYKVAHDDPRAGKTP